MNIVNNYSTSIITIIQKVIKDYEFNIAEIKRIEDALNDLNHEIELSPPKDMYKGWQMYSGIRELRVRRRQLKEEVEFMRDMYEYFKGQQGQNFKTKLQQLQGASVKLREVQKNRTYKPRQRTDLTIEGHHSDEPKTFEQMIAEFNKTKVRVEAGKLRK